jgi:hypothetical protein
MHICFIPHHITLLDTDLETRAGLFVHLLVVFLSILLENADMGCRSGRQSAISLSFVWPILAGAGTGAGW